MATPTAQLARNQFKLKQQLLTLSATWPRDPLRPTLQFGDAIKAATERIFTAPPGSKSAEGNLKVLNDQEVIKVQEMVGSLERLLRNDAAKQFRITDKTLKPPSFPNHYSKLAEAIKKAERGEVEKPGWFSWFRWSRD